MSNNGKQNGKSLRMETLLRLRQNYARFDPKEVPAKCLDRVLELARLAPTEWRFQAGRWIVVRSKTGKQQLESCTQADVPLASAPVLLICLADTAAWKTAPQQLRDLVAEKGISPEIEHEVLSRIREYYSASPQMAQRAALADAFVALHQILQAVADCHLSAYWVSMFDEQKIKTHFHIPDNFLVAAVLAVGYGEYLSPPSPELPLQAVVYEEKFGEAYVSA